VVEDDPQSRRALQLLLEDDGYDVRLAANGVEGLERALSWRPDVVLSDVNMPKMDGLTLVRELTVRAADLPVVLMSAHPALAAQARGAYGFFAKPLDFGALERGLERACRDAAPARRSFGGGKRMAHP
jgi:DNA-binding NtrC family response regulator